MEKTREFHKNIYFCFSDYTKALDHVGHNKLWKILRDGSTRPPYLSPYLTHKHVCGSKQQLEPYMEQLTGSKLRKECNRLYVVTLLI